jgi:hypothetical protein
MGFTKRRTDMVTIVLLDGTVLESLEGIVVPEELTIEIYERLGWL